MKLENEFTFIASMINEYIATLPEGAMRMGVMGHAVLCMTLIEMELRGDTQVDELVLDQPTADAITAEVTE